MTISKKEQVRLWDEQERSMDAKLARRLQQLRWQQAQEKKREKEKKQ